MKAGWREKGTDCMQQYVAMKEAVCWSSYKRSYMKLTPHAALRWNGNNPQTKQMMNG